MSQRRPHIRELDGIRAIAVGLVLVTHLFGEATIVPSWYVAGAPAPIRVVVTHGWLGVDLFFVLSGFLITGILLDAKGSPGYYRGFYVRRVLRILPLYFTVLLVLIAAYGVKPYATYWLFAVALCANLSALVPHTPTPFAAGPMWSLGVEEQFYFFWPLIVARLSRRQLTIVAIGIVLIEPFVRYRLGPAQLFFPWCRFDGLALGALLALWFSAPGRERVADLRRAGAMAAVAVVMIVVAAPFGGFSEGPLSTAIRISEATLFFAACIAAAISLRDSRPTAILRSTALRVVADLSFCIYLVHVPLLETFQYATQHWLPALAGCDPRILVPVRAAVVVGAAFGVAILSRRYLELPAQRLRTVLLPPRPVSRDAAMVEHPAQ